MAKLVIDIKDSTKRKIIRMATSCGQTIKAFVLDKLGLKE